MPEATPELGVTWSDDAATFSVFSANADSVELCFFSDQDPGWVAQSHPLARDTAAAGVWSVTIVGVKPGQLYAYRAAGPGGADAPKNAFAPDALLIDPYGHGIFRHEHDWRSVAVSDAFDWGGDVRPNTPLDKTVIYEAHVKGLTKRNTDIPEPLRGTYAALGHGETIEYLTDLGITAVELLPMHAFANEPRLRTLGLTNYWGYNSISFFAPHPRYASAEALSFGAELVNREFKTAVKSLHAAGIEVILDVVYNHTAEGGRGGPTLSFKGLDAASYYRQDARGMFIDTTGCGNTIDFSQQVAIDLVLDSLRYWVSEYHIDGFRFDLAATLGRGANGSFDPRHPLLTAIVSDPRLQNTKMIAEPWDVGIGGWQTGNFPLGWAEWNDRYRDKTREFWLSDTAVARRSGYPQGGIGTFAGALAGSADLFTKERGPLTSVNFVTAHDGFTLADLVSFNVKHNAGNGESNRDGTDNNHSFNHGAEGHTIDGKIGSDRRKAERNLLATLLCSSGVPMLTAGDEFARSQQGNNNAYCQDSSLTWLPWERSRVQLDLLVTTKHLLQLRHDNPALRPMRYAVLGERTPSASQMLWFNADGLEMSIDDWQSPGNRTLQYFAASTPEFESFNQVLMVVHGLESEVTITLPAIDTVGSYDLVWDSAWETPQDPQTGLREGDTFRLTGNSIKVLIAHVDPSVVVEPNDPPLPTAEPLREAADRRQP